MYYSSFGVLSLVITLIINNDVLTARKKADIPDSTITYKHFLYSVMVYYVSDITWGILYENHLIALAYADTVVYFISMAVSMLLWTIYAVEYLGRKNVFSTILTLFGWLILVYNTVSLIINFFLPAVFSFEGDVYVPGDARYITLVAQILLYLMTSVYTLIVAAKSKGKARSHHMAIGFSGIVMTVFINLQTFYPLWPFYAIGCLIATCIVYRFITDDEKMDRSLELGSAKQKAYTDPLTGVKSAYAYSEAKDRINKRIAEGTLSEFGVVVFDLNSLKDVNDTKGHDFGDRYLREASRLISSHFKRSPVYRIGGDEFLAFLEGDDYHNRDSLIESFDRISEENRDTSEPVVVASGMSVFSADTDIDFNAVFARADQKMYEKKQKLKDGCLNCR